MDSSSKKYTNCHLEDGLYDLLIFSFSMNRPVFVLVSCRIKWALLLLYSGIISSGFCFYFYHLWWIFLRTDNSWLPRSYYLAKYNSWNCALLDISTRVYPITSSFFLRIFVDMTSSIECECAILMSFSNKEDICFHRIWFWLLISPRTYLITADKLLLSVAT